jgi:hypothetical protein
MVAQLCFPCALNGLQDGPADDAEPAGGGGGSDEGLLGDADEAGLSGGLHFRTHACLCA